MKVIGVTGGIGSGKSTVSNYLKVLGAQIVDADKVAREITIKGSKVLDELKDEFGDSIIDEEGNLNRLRLSEIVFNSTEKLDKLNEITHNHIAKRIIEMVNRIKNEKSMDIIVVDAPIPIEYGFMDVVDEVWVIAADKNSRINRIIQRNGCTWEEAEKRIDSQMNDKDYFKKADRIIYNNESMTELEKSIKYALLGDEF